MSCLIGMTQFMALLMLMSLENALFSIIMSEKNPPFPFSVKVKMLKVNNLYKFIFFGRFMSIYLPNNQVNFIFEKYTTVFL